ncbi:MAG: DNA-3-methyladenine glycosylase I [Gammaproteobacteria bacterium]|nr:DNA-3-methyladenine glycosylase I [Gammaproteobacteria bacterium]
MADVPVRCAWAGNDPLMQRYHDEEWGVPMHDDRALFELLVLEGAQAGLSWRTILHRREGYRAAFDGFDIARVAGYGQSDRERLVSDARIIRNRAKIDAAIANARATMDVQARHGSLDAFLWSFVGGKPRLNAFHDLSELPARTEVSQAMSKALRSHGFSFVGPTICYAFMQSAGLVNDHVATCFRYADQWIPGTNR